MLKHQLPVILCGLLCSNLSSQQIVTDRPDQTESALCLYASEFQLESGISWTFNDLDNTTLKSLVIPGTLVRYGLGGPLEFRLFHQLVREDPGPGQQLGVADLEVGFKFRIRDSENSSTKMAFLTHVILPSGTRFLTNHKYGSLNKFCVSHGVSGNSSIGYNLGYNYYGEGKGDLSYSLSYGFGISDRAAVFLEGYGVLEEMDEPLINFDAGFTYAIKPKLQIDFSWGTGIQRRMNFVSAGLSWKTGRNK